MPWTSKTSFCFNLNWINSKLKKDAEVLSHCRLIKVWWLQNMDPLAGFFLHNKKPVTDYQGVSEHQRKTCSRVKSNFKT